jgi:hypothetical protein
VQINDLKQFNQFLHSKVCSVFPDSNQPRIISHFRSHTFKPTYAYCPFWFSPWKINRQTTLPRYSCPLWLSPEINRQKPLPALIISSKYQPAKTTLTLHKILHAQIPAPIAYFDLLVKINWHMAGNHIHKILRLHTITLTTPCQKSPHN